jgi:hypothetical protein
MLKRKTKLPLNAQISIMTQSIFGKHGQRTKRFFFHFPSIFLKTWQEIEQNKKFSDILPKRLPNSLKIMHFLHEL